MMKHTVVRNAFIAATLTQFSARAGEPAPQPEAASRVQITIDYMCNNLAETNFAILDKQSAEFTVVEDCDVTLETPALLGKGGGDYGSVSSNITNAGIFTTLIEKGYDKNEYHLGSVIHFQCDTDDEGQLTRCDSIHGLWLGVPEQNRPVRLSSPNIEDNRISNGCVNLANDAFENVLNFYMNLSSRTSLNGAPYFVVLPESLGEGSLENWLHQNTHPSMSIE